MQQLGPPGDCNVVADTSSWPNTAELPPCGCNVFDRDFGIDFEKSVFYFLMLICLIFNTGFTLFKTQKNTWHVVGPFRARGLKNGQKGPI